MNKLTILADAFFAGSDAFKADQPETVNPYAPDSDLAHQWSRGYRNTRKSARFDATIRARQQGKCK